MSYEDLKTYFKRDMSDREISDFAREMLAFNGTVIRDQTSAKLAILRMNKSNLSKSEYISLLGIIIGREETVQVDTEEPISTTISYSNVDGDSKGVGAI